MLTGIYQSVPFILVLVAYYILDTWLMRRYSPKNRLLEKRDTLNTTVIFVGLILVVVQPVLMPWLGLQFSGKWAVALQIIGIIFLIIGLCLIAWVRLHLKGLFSERVELQPEHYIVDTGPYALARHPLYTTFCLMSFGMLLVQPAIFELLILCFMLWHFSKLAKEEDTMLSNELPGYKEYMAVTPSFIPYLWRASKD